MTRGNNFKRTRRLMGNAYGDEFVIELGWDIITIRPKRSRRGGQAEVVLLPGLLYIQAIRQQLAAEKKRPAGRRRARQ